MTLFAPLVPAAVAVAERREAGDEADLFAEESRCVERAVPKRRREFAAGRACAREALARLGVAAAPLLVAPDRSPAWPRDVVGSITHTAGYAAAAVASRAQVRAIGIDAEKVGRLEPALWPDVCTADELAWLRARPETERAAFATLVFAAKEAFYKCSSVLAPGWLGFHDVTVDVGDGTFVAAARESEPLAGRFAFANGLVVAAVCVTVTGA